ncbi:aldehyde dehydrogenase family protein [Pseudomonas sp. CNPSo 3701]|uniref:aldehyde dehydrogenase family protein n=1 Tax=Pseudomonas sp. CNPSo 3701 TaxID=3027943 RepID=UPI00236327FF|nr:aldehyde dehydrogenase family protein [Pseudomonas sp. CNPSo 3701]MDD1506815.1 aldehyde dehydrogenase family protein [Pseudomonas sp. CNPSo 3701]
MSHIERNLIAGAWWEGAGSLENRNPSDLDDLIGHYAIASPDEVADACAAAAEAQQEWRYSTPQVRAELLERIAQGIAKREQEIATMLAREEGKILSEALAETRRAVQIFRFYAGEALRLAGESIASVRSDIDIETRREPIGVVGLITPWNFPIAIPAWKVAPALAYGNSVVLKPAELTPGTAHLLASIIREAGCPAGVFNLVMGPGASVGAALVDNPHVRGLSFTGSVPTGRRIAQRAAVDLKRVQLEMGGKNPMVILEDADLEVAVEASLNGSFHSTGQRCTASSRLIVQASIHDAFVDALAKRMASLKVGHALASDSQIGPVVSAEQLASNLRYVRLAAAEGCEVIGGEHIELRTRGHYQRPALFLGAGADMQVSQEEIFGPCASVIRVDDFDEALQVANGTAFGLSAGICTRSLKHAREFRRQVQSGMVMINVATAGVDYHVPFGGTKASSFGPREQGRAAAEFYTLSKTAYQFSG